MSLRFYKKIVKELKKYRFEIDPYDPCVTNKVINGKKMTVLWHADDIKVSHVDPWEINKFGLYLLN